MEWISVEDRLPICESEMEGINYKTIEVIVATKDIVTADTFAAGNTHDYWCGFSDYGYNVTHWSLLPAPPTIDGKK